jgi:acetyltransferase
VRFGQLVVEQRAVKEIDINPLVVSPDGFLALDARMALNPPELSEKDLPKLAIAPYPSQYVRASKLRDGRPITIRPIRPEDEPRMVKFHEALSDRSVHFRYFHMMNLSQRVAHERLARVCFIDYDCEMALVAETGSEIIGVGRLSKLHGEAEAEFAVVVRDQFQGLGLGTELLRTLIEVARREDVSRIVGYVLPENRAMQRLCEKVGFQLHYDIDEGVLRAEIDVHGLPPPLAGADSGISPDRVI